MTLLVDSHCHIPLIEGASADVIIDAAKQQGIGHMLCVCVDMEGFPAVRALAGGHDCISASVGLHPNAQAGSEPDAGELALLADDPEVIAIGETGLDYYRSTGDLDWQRERFRVHVRAAKQAGKPLIIHSREARDDVVRILAEEGAREVGGIMHCFVDDWDTAQRCMELDFYISFSGIVTFRNARDLQEVAKRVPPERLLVETDAPYLAPVPMRGKQNQPAFVRHTAAFLAELRGTTFDDIAAQTTGNFRRLFPGIEL